MERTQKKKPELLVDIISSQQSKKEHTPTGSSCSQAEEAVPHGPHTAPATEKPECSEGIAQKGRLRR